MFYIILNIYNEYNYLLKKIIPYYTYIIKKIKLKLYK